MQWSEGLQACQDGLVFQELRPLQMAKIWKEVSRRNQNGSNCRVGPGDFKSNTQIDLPIKINVHTETKCGVKYCKLQV